MTPQWTAEIESAVLVAAYGSTIGDRALCEAGRWALSTIREGISV